MTLVIDWFGLTSLNSGLAGYKDMPSLKDDLQLAQNPFWLVFIGLVLRTSRCVLILSLALHHKWNCLSWEQFGLLHALRKCQGVLKSNRGLLGELEAVKTFYIFSHDLRFHIVNMRLIRKDSKARDFYKISAFLVQFRALKFLVVLKK